VSEKKVVHSAETLAKISASLKARAAAKREAKTRQAQPVEASVTVPEDVQIKIVDTSDGRPGPWAHDEELNFWDRCYFGDSRNLAAVVWKNPEGWAWRVWGSEVGLAIESGVCPDEHDAKKAADAALARVPKV
jgi:hypothetical protein